jgi:hypothetical protein
LIAPDDVAPVTVVMATFNRAPYIRETLDSLLGQSRSPARVIVVDDGSADSTPEILCSYGPRIEYIRKDNGGKSSALNLALPLVQTEFTWVFDDDDVALKAALESHLNTFSAQPGADFTYSSHLTGRDGPGGRIEVVDLGPSTDVPPDDVFVSLLDKCFLLQQGMLTRTRCYREVGPYAVELVRSQDYEMMLRLAHRFTGAHNPEITFILREHGGTRGSAANPVPHRSRTDVWADHAVQIGAHYLEALDLHEYLGKGRGPSPPLTPDERRAALLMRASIVARKGLWQSAIGDLQLALQDARTQGSLAPQERAAVRSMTRMVYPRSFAPLLNDRNVVTSLRRTIASNPVGREVRTALLEGLKREFVLSLRRRTLTTAVRIPWVMARLMATP